MSTPTVLVSTRPPRRRRRPRPPIVLRLHLDALARGDGVARLLRARTGRVCPKLLSYFAFKNDERAFAASLLARHARFWLFRTHQGRFAGDFVAIDMSERRVERRRAFCLDLKRGSKLVFGGGGAGNAFVGLAPVVRRLAGDRRVLTADHDVARISGDGARLLDALTG